MKKSCVFFIIAVAMTICTSIRAEYYSQLGQDRFVNECFFKGKKNGVFVDIGAYDGKFISNTYFFEKECGWSGICIEPLSRAYAQLINNRSCICLNCAVGETNGTINFLEIDANKFPDLAMLSGLEKFFSNERIAHLQEDARMYDGFCRIITVPVRKLNDILNDHNLFNIDFLSIDIEGGELDVLFGLNFDKFKIHVMAVENNAREANQEIRLFLESKGFRFVKRIEVDEIYENMLFNDVNR